MTKMRISMCLGIAGLTLAASCGVDLTVPTNAIINCNGDDECPEGYVCGAGVCDLVLVNVAPSVTLRATERRSGAVPLELVVADANGNSTRTELVSIALRSVIGGVRCPVAALSTSLEGISATRGGTTVNVTWNAIADASVDCGLATRPADRDGDGIGDDVVYPVLDDVVVEAIATDAAGVSSAVASAAVSLGNDTPVLTVTSPPAAASGDVPLVFAVADTSLDPAAVDLQFALPGEPRVWQTGSIRYGATAGIVTDGAEQVIVWDSLAADGGVGAFRVTDVLLRLRARDDVDGPDFGAFDEVTLTVDNQSAPAVENLQLTGDGFGRATGVAYLTYRLVDTQSDPTDVHVELSVDGEPFTPCTPYPNAMHSGTYALATAPTRDEGGGVAHVFAWDVIADLRTRTSTNVQVRVVPADERAGPGAAATLQVGSRVGLGAGYTGSGGYKLLATTSGTLGERVFAGFFDGANTDVVSTTSSGTYLASGNGDGSFDPPVLTGPTVGLNRATESGDLNGDAYTDYAILDDDGPTLRVLYGGITGLTVQQTLSLPGGCDPHSRRLAFGDFDGDGQNEIAFGCGTTIRLAVRATTWAIDASLYSAGADVFRLAAGDTNGDGRDELVVARLATVTGAAATFEVVILPGQAQAQRLGSPVRLAADLPLFYSNALRFNEQGADLAVTELDGDNRAEVVVATAPFQTSGSVRVYRGSSLGSPPLVSDLLPERPAYLSIADVDGDGTRDIVTWGCVDTGAPCVFMHALGVRGLKPTGRARLPDVTCPDVSRSSGEAVDLDADGRAELVVAELCPASGALVTYAFGSGSTPTTLTDTTALSEAPTASNEVTLVDFDRDGALDVMLAQNSGLVAQVRAGAHQLPTVAPGVTLLAAGSIGLSFENTSIYRAVAADYTGDGLPDIFTSDRSSYTTTVNVATHAADGTYAFEGADSGFVSGQPLDRAIAVADMNGDGFDDIVGSFDRWVVVLRADVSAGAWAGTFTAVTNFDTTLSSITYATVGDIDRDGDLDVAASAGADVVVLLNNGSGVCSLSCARNLPGAHVNRRSQGVAIADTTDDGFADIVAALQENPGGNNDVQLCVLQFTSGGCDAGFSCRSEVASVAPLDRLGVADLDGDGVQDVYGVAPQKVLAWTTRRTNGLANGFLGTPVNLTTALARSDVVDFDRDGTADVVGVTGGNAVLLAHGLQQNVGDSRRVALTSQALLGVTPTRTVDAFGEPIIESLGLRTYSGFGRFSEPVRIDFPADAAKALVLGTIKRPLTRAWELEGLTRLAPTSDGRYRVEEALDLDADAGRAVIIDLPLLLGRQSLDLATNVRVVMRADDFVRASEYVDDLLFAQSAGADVLPLTKDRHSPVLERTSTWLDIPRDADGDLSTGSGRRYIVENIGATRRVRVVIDVPGVIQAFVQ